MDPETHLRLLGEATARGHQLELCTTQILARALVITESSARLLTGSMGQSAALGVLHGLATSKECGQLDPDELIRWLAKAKEANEARNRVIHSPWVRDAEGDEGTLSTLARRSMKLEPRSREELQEDIDSMATAVVFALDLV